MKVVSLTEYRFRDTIAVLRALLYKAVRGEIFGLAICVLTNSAEDYFFTGKFKQDSAQALKAANRLSWKMNQAIDALESGFGP